MKSTFIKLVAVLMSAAMLAGVAAGCGKTNNSSENKPASASPEAKKAEPAKEAAKILNCRYVVPGSAKPETEAAAGEISKKMQADGVNVQLKLDYIPWDVWENKVNVMFASGEEMDLIHTMDNYIPNTQALLGKNGIVALNEYLDKYGPDLKKRISPEAWKQATFEGGKIYAVPAEWIELANVEGWVNYRKDLFDKYGIAEPKTPQEMIQAALTLQQKVQQEKGEKWFILNNGIAKSNLWLFRSFNTFPFVLKESEELVMISNKGEVKSWVESEEFKKQCEFFSECKKKGLLNPNLLSMKNDEYTKLGKEGKYLFSLTRNFAGIKATVPEAEMGNFLLNPEKKNLRATAYANCNTVPITSKHPEAAIMFLNWLHKSADNMGMLLYGVKDKHWSPAEDRGFKWSDSNKDGKTYSFDNWMIGNMDLMLFNSTNSPMSRKVEYTPNKDADNFVAMGFNFDPTNVKVEYANCMAEMQSSFYPLKFGFVEYEKGYEAGLKKMKAAGIDKIVAEYKTQLDKFMKSKAK